MTETSFKLITWNVNSVRIRLELLKKLVNQAKDRIIILPGCGVNPGNARYIIEETGACELHGSLRKDGHTDKNMVRQTLLAINAESLA